MERLQTLLCGRAPKTLTRHLLSKVTSPLSKASDTASSLTKVYSLRLPKPVTRTNAPVFLVEGLFVLSSRNLPVLWAGHPPTGSRLTRGSERKSLSQGLGRRAGPLHRPPAAGARALPSAERPISSRVPTERVTRAPGRQAAPGRGPRRPARPLRAGPLAPGQPVGAPGRARRPPGRPEAAPAAPLQARGLPRGPRGAAPRRRRRPPRSAGPHKRLGPGLSRAPRRPRSPRR